MKVESEIEFILAKIKGTITEAASHLQEEIKKLKNNGLIKIVKM